jgi:hypothetical protein
MTDYSLATLLDLLGPFVDSRLVGPNVFSRLRNVAQLLPPLPGMLLECRLASHMSEVDLCLRVDANDGGRDIFAGKHPSFQLPDSWLQEPTWQAVVAFCQDWLNPDLPYYQCIETIWLEFDYPLIASSLLSPSFFILIPNANPELNIQTLYEIINRTLASNRVQAVSPCLDRLLRNRPDGASVYALGLMQSRSTPSIRLCIMIPFADVSEYIAQLGLTWVSSPISALYSKFSSEVDTVCLNLDINLDAASELLPVVGIEVKPSSVQQSSNLIGKLLQNNLCELTKSDALRDWSGYSTPKRGDNHLPQHAKIAVLDHAKAYDTVMFVRRINHFKFVYRPQTPVVVKTYLYTGFGWD